jgi:hypothetical protein
MASPSPLSPNRPIIDVQAFVDWQAQLIQSGVNADLDLIAATESALRQTTRRLARCLADVGSLNRYRVNLRLYFGWHKGYEPSPGLKAARTVLARADFAVLSQRANVIFSPSVEYGCRLSNALQRRLHARLAIHLPNSVRRRPDEKFEEKMVDTALAADVVSSAFLNSSSWQVIVTEDDDLVPPAFVAEAILAGSGSRIILLRRRGQAGMLRLDDILMTG